MDFTGLNTTISKEFTFDAAHHLPNHDGKCKNLHGHTYRVVIFARGPIKPLDGGPEEGMVLDFSKIKGAFKDQIEKRADHKYLNASLPLESTTAENLSWWMLTELRQDHKEIFKVRVYETPTSYAEAALYEEPAQ